MPRSRCKRNSSHTLHHRSSCRRKSCQHQLPEQLPDNSPCIGTHPSAFPFLLPCVSAHICEDTRARLVFLTKWKELQAGCGCCGCVSTMAGSFLGLARPSMWISPNSTLHTIVPHFSSVVKLILNTMYYFIVTHAAWDCPTVGLSAYGAESRQEADREESRRYLTPK